MTAATDTSAQGHHSGDQLDTGLMCLVSILKYLRKPCDPAQLVHQLGKGREPLCAEDILRAAKHLEIKGRLVSPDWQDLAQLPLPAIAEAKDATFFILAKHSEGKVLVQSPLAEGPRELSEADMQDIWSGRLIFLTTREAPVNTERGFDLRWFIPAIVRYRKLFREVIIASCFLQIFALMTPLFFQVVIDKVLVHKGLTTLDVMVFGLLVVTVFEVVVGALRMYVLSHTTTRVDVELGAKLFGHLSALPLSYFENRRTGETVARVRELETIRDFLTSSSVTLLIDLFFTLIFFVVMYLYAPLLTFIVLGSIPLYVAISIFITPALRGRLEEKFYRGAANQAFLVETVSGARTLKSMAVEPQMQRRWEDQLAAYVSSSFRANMLSNFGSHAVQFVSKVTLALTLYFGALMVIEGALTVGMLVAFNMLSSRVSQPVLRMAQLWQDFQQVRIALDRLGDILNSPAEALYNANRTTLPSLEGRVSFEDVTFRYRPEGPDVLRRISLDLSAGEIVGIVGPSGSGKSTLTSLLQRLYVPQTGRILVDGVDLALVDPAWLRRQVGVVLQENLLFNRSVRENIALADPSRDMEAVVERAKIAGAHDFILELPQGYDTVIDERGSNLSGGQRQRIAIARALMNDPRILILDEATSALDAHSEEIIQRNLKQIAAQRTVLIIAHRVSALRQVQRILSINHGEIVEDGTHAELMAREGLYADFYRRQARDYGGGSGAAD